VYKGNKKPTAKECVLIIDHETGTYTLEKLDQNVFVKKTRYLHVTRFLVIMFEPLKPFMLLQFVLELHLSILLKLKVTSDILFD
jgi:hypothetical protein